MRNNRSTTYDSNAPEFKRKGRMLAAVAALILAVGGLTACERGGENGGDVLKTEPESPGQTQDQPQEREDTGMPEDSTQPMQDGAGEEGGAAAPEKGGAAPEGEGVEP